MVLLGDSGPSPRDTVRLGIIQIYFQFLISIFSHPWERSLAMPRYSVSLPTLVHSPQHPPQDSIEKYGFRFFSLLTLGFNQNAFTITL